MLCVIGNTKHCSKRCVLTRMQYVLAIMSLFQYNMMVAVPLHIPFSFFLSFPVSHRKQQDRGTCQHNQQELRKPKPATITDETNN